MPCRGRRSLLLRERGEDFASRLRPDAGYLGSRPSAPPPAARPRSTRPAPRRSRVARCGAEPEHPAEPDELRRHRAPSSASSAISPVSTSSRSRASMPRPDPAQLANAALPHELRDRHRRLADHLRRAPVGPRRVRLRTREIEQRRERVEPVRDFRVRDSTPLRHGHSLPVELRFIDEFEHGFGWTPEGDRLERASHAIRIGNSVWLTDVLDGPGIDERITKLGEPRAVIQLLDRHERDCPAFAARLGVPLHATPFGGVPDAPFDVIPVVHSRFWKEVALWFAAERILVVGDALGDRRLLQGRRRRAGRRPSVPAPEAATQGVRGPRTAPRPLRTRPGRPRRRRTRCRPRGTRHRETPAPAGPAQRPAGCQTPERDLAPQQSTLGFQAKKSPLGLPFHAQACSA